MGLLKPASNGSAFLKVGTLGFEGSGKTRTAVEIAIGMTKLVKGTKVAFFDTEKGSDFHIERFKKEGIQLDVLKSKAFKDLCETIREAQSGGYSFLIIDSITHVWRELTESYLRSKGRKNLTMKDWGALKMDWAQYTDLYVNSKVHIAMCGRAGYEYDTTEDEDGKMEVTKSGTKMKVETETGYEPDLLLEMVKVPNSEIRKDKRGKPDKKAKGWINRCYVLKDRSDKMNGHFIDYPTFKDFLPVVKFLNIGGEHVGTEGRTSDAMFGKPDYSWEERRRRREIATEAIKEALVLGGLDGTAKEVKLSRTKTLIDVFGTSTEPGMNELPLERLEGGLINLKIKLGLKPAGETNGVAPIIALAGQTMAAEADVAKDF